MSHSLPESSLPESGNNLRVPGQQLATRQSPRRRRKVAFRALLLGAILGGIASAATLLAGSQQVRADEVGWSTTKPESGPFVEFDGKFMVPYQASIPGTPAKFEMIPVPGGVVVAGSPEGEEGHKEDEGPQVEVELAPYWVGKTEVTWHEYRQYMRMYDLFKKLQTRGVRVVTEENKVNAVTAPTALYDPSFTFEYGDKPELPAVTMTQYAAKQYTKWLSALTGDQYRLPSEAEWEHAARGGAKSAYSFGDDASQLDEYAWYSENTEAGAKPVGTKKPNPFGLHDMHGNVAEWTIDAYTEDGFKAIAGKKLSFDEAIQWSKVPYPRTVRGGSWENDATEVRSASRMGSNDEDWKQEDPNIPLSPWWYTSDPARGVGFRLVRSAKPLNEERIKKFWEIDHEDIKLDVEIRIDEGRGVLGVVDKELIKEIEQVGK